MYRAFVALFDAVDDRANALWRGIRSGLQAAWDGWLGHLALGIIVSLTGLGILAARLLELLDRLVALVERAFLTVALLAMVWLIFNDYLFREYSFAAVGLKDGPNMALVLMVWVGFLGASLATRRRGHLAVDATDRVLSPKAARFVKRFSALAAAGLAWTLCRASWGLVVESVEFEDSVEGLSVWNWLAPPLNAVIRLLPGQPVEGVDWPTVTAGGDFPLWLAQLVLPLSFAFIAARFLMAAVLGRFDAPPDPDAPAERAPIPEPTPPGTRTARDVVMAGLFPGLLLGMGAALYFDNGPLILIACVLLVLVGAPLFVAIGVAAIASANLIGNYDTVAVVTDMFEATKKHELLAIPFFVLAGNLMTRGSIAERLIDIARAFMGRTPGGLGLASVAACAVFAAISGSSPVTVIAIGSIMYPMLVRDGYPSSYGMGVLTAAGGLGIIIPPSVPMIVYAIVVSTPTSPIPPSELFLGGVLPGLFIAACLSAYTLVRTRHVPLPHHPGGDLTLGGWLRGIGRALRSGILALMLPVLVLGGIYGLLTLEPFGIDFSIRLTVTEAAAVACVYALVVELFIHRELKLRGLPAVLVESAVMMGSLFLILVLAIAFNRFLTLQQIPQQAADWLVSHIDSRFTFIVLVNLFLLALGCVMDILSAILIVAPLLAPIAAAFGLHPVHFAIMFIVNLEIGYMTPPMGINLFVASTVFKRSVVDVIKAVLPFLLIMLFCLVVIAWLQPLSTALLPADAVTGPPR
ncbi:MAG: TRAP transporter large permease subunit [Deltaproteobacteria bacterium]|nr:MAG: TRAP transporter large permease subunit [Deltaproteobacteria bacterium]